MRQVSKSVKLVAFKKQYARVLSVGPYASPHYKVGAEFEVLKLNKGSWCEFTADIRIPHGIAFILADDCAHLDRGSWEIVTKTMYRYVPIQPTV